MNFMQMVQQFRQNPQQALQQMGIPQNLANDPNKIIQYMMNNSIISQEQYNQAAQMARQFQNMK